VSIHMVVCEPDPVGSDAVATKLMSRGVLAGMSLPPTVKLSQDTEMKLIVQETADIYVSRMHREGWLMVQPALVVLDETGKVVPELTWSWKTMGFTGDQDYETGPQGIPVFRCRPDFSDIGTAIKERRPIRLIDVGMG
jgi:hypothetical protein